MQVRGAVRVAEVEKCSEIVHNKTQKRNEQGTKSLDCRMVVASPEVFPLLL